MHARPIDPTKEITWRFKPTRFRVRFFEPLGAGVSPSSESGVMYQTEEFELVDVDNVLEVVDWADANAAGRGYTVTAVLDRGTEHGLIHLLGDDPTSP